MRSTEAYLDGTPSREDLENELSQLQARVRSSLAPYDAESAVCLWLDSLRAIEEMINLMTVDWRDAAFEAQLFSLPVLEIVNGPLELQAVYQRLESRFSTPFANRFRNLVVLGSAIGTSFVAHGAAEARSAFQTVGSMIGYLQSRRRHFVGLLHLLPSACRGSRKVTLLNTLNFILPIIEFDGVPMMGAQYSLMIKLAQERLGIPDDPEADLAMLNAQFLEPERASIIEMEFLEREQEMLASKKEPLQEDRLFSAAELRNDILFSEAAYAEFGLRETEFSTAAALVRRLSFDYIERDFWVQISPENLGRLMDECGASPALRAELICNSDSYMKCLSTYSPFVLLGQRYISTVTLLSRFIYFWRARVLERQKRFQIRAGFIFEEQVKQQLASQGFKVHDIVRINRKEFDVVTTRDGVIWNVQCKNNFIDLERVDSNATSFARYNLALVRSYERALVKEHKREDLLKNKLGLDEIEHMLVSKFPVLTNNQRIVVFNRIGDFGSRANALLGP